MSRNNKKDKFQSKLENIKLDLDTYKILLHFQNHAEPLVIYFDKPARRFYFSLIALIVTEMKRLNNPDFIHIRKHENTLKLLDNSLAGQYASKTASGMWDKVRKAWRYTLPDLETGTHFKILDRDLISPYEKGGKFRYECADNECDIWANLFGYNESNPWRFKFAFDSASLNLNDVSVTLGDLRDNSAWKEFLKRLSTPQKAVSKKKQAEQRWWQKAAFALVAALVVGSATFAIWNFYVRPAPPTTKLELAGKPSIAVMPFKNLSEDPKQEYFSDGITDTLITDLSKISGLFIIASNSVFTYKGKPVTILQVGRDLGVRYVMEGSVQKTGNQVRINAQLIDAKTGGHLWAERYDGKMDDIFALQDKITNKITSALAVKLTAGEKALVGHKETNDIAAYQEFLKGRVHYRRNTTEDFAKAEECFKRAIELDPNYGKARAALAMLYWWAAQQRKEKAFNISYIEARLRARQYLKEAMKEPTSIAYQLAGLMDLALRQYDEAISHFEKALALDSNDPDCVSSMGRVLSFSGRPEEGLEYTKDAMRMDPLNPARYLAYMGVAYFCMGQWQETVTVIESALKLNPEYRAFAGFLASAYGHLGRDDEARAAATTFRRGSPSRVPFTALPPERPWMFFYAFKDRKVADAFLDSLKRVGLIAPGPEYIHVSKKDQLTGAELKAFYFPSKITGYSVIDGSEWSLENTKDGTVTLRAPFVPDGVDMGKMWIEGDKVWIQYSKFYFGIPFCYTTFKNPRGSYEGKDEYVSFLDLYLSPFSRVH